METVKLKSPVDGSVYAERPVATDRDIAAAVERARAAQAEWAETSIAERAGYLIAFLDAMLAMNDDIVPELAWQMGRPVRFTPGEVRGFEERARYMLEIAEEVLAHLAGLVGAEVSVTLEIDGATLPYEPVPGRPGLYRPAVQVPPPAAGTDFTLTASWSHHRATASSSLPQPVAIDSVSYSTTVLPVYVYESAFELKRYGYANALGMVLMVIMLVFTLGQWRLNRQGDN